MLGEPTTFWGKLHRSADGQVCEWHPLVDHCADVAAVSEALLAIPIWRRRLASLARQNFGEIGWARLCVLAALHDLGKFNLGFQAKGRPALGATAGHVQEALAALFKLSCLDPLADWGDGVTGLLVSAICHHGRPYNIDASAGSWQATWWNPRDGLDPAAGVSQLVAQCRSWFPDAFDPGGSPLTESAPFSHAFAGLVMLADWIGSDTRFFPFTSNGHGDRMTFARARASQALAALALDGNPTARLDPAGRDAFARVARTGYQPRPAQTALLSLPQDPQGSISILEAETGSGKTEAALARFVTLFEAGLVDGMYFALPTRSAATQMHRRVYEAVQQAFASPPAVVLAVPGYLRVDDVEGQRERLPSFDVLWPDRERFRYRAWAAENAKRFLVGCIVVGTIDQVLLSGLMVGHAHLRATSLLRHLLVVDEVHASDAYMARVLEDVLARHVAAGGHALLLSATLGGEARERLLHPGEFPVPPTLAAAEATPYPRVTHRGGDCFAVSITRGDTARLVRVTARPWIEYPDALAAAAFDMATGGAKVLVIKNTVSDCVATQVEIERLAAEAGRLDLVFECGGARAPHHARFARLDRQSLDGAIDSRFGVKRPDGGCVVIATQTVQQSLDLDSDVLFTDLCPADVLLQRIGRLHRHARTRPRGFEVAQAFVAVPGGRDLTPLIGASGVAHHHHGLGSVYSDLRILEATWRLLEEHGEWLIPEMNRHLVERSVHSTALSVIVAAGGQVWRRHEMQMMGRSRAESRQAQLNVVNWTQPYAEMSFPDVADEHIATRLGEGDRRVRLPSPVASPFGNTVTEFVLPGWLVPDVPSDAEYAEAVSSAEGATRFRFGGRPFVYDRHGLRPDQSLPKEVNEDDGP